jgi:hypothetical protein
MPYVACHVDLFGFARATYELQAMDDERAKAEAKEYLTSTSPLRRIRRASDTFQT